MKVRLQEHGPRGKAPDHTRSLEVYAPDKDISYRSRVVLRTLDGGQVQCELAVEADELLRAIKAVCP